jgi:hypothetical protein
MRRAANLPPTSPPPKFGLVLVFKHDTQSCRSIAAH